MKQLLTNSIFCILLIIGLSVDIKIKCVTNDTCDSKTQYSYTGLNDTKISECTKDKCIVDNELTLDVR